MLEGLSHVHCIVGEVICFCFLQETQVDASIKISQLEVPAAELGQVEGGERVNR